MPKNAFGLPEFDPETLAAQQRYSNWLTAVHMGWTAGKEMNCRNKDEFPKIAKELADKYYEHLQAGEYLLEVKMDVKKV